MACLDTSVPIDLSRSSSNPRHVDAKNVVQAREASGELLFVPRPAEAEFRVGGYRLLGGIAERDKIEHVLNGFGVLDLDEDSARQFARYKAHLLDIGRPVGDMDILIGAIAYVRSQTLITRNRRHFADMPGLAGEGY